VRVYAGKDGVVWLRRSAPYESVWRPRAGRVSRVAFGTLERFTRDNEVTVLPTQPEDYGGLPPVADQGR
jgi:hypothetical protein